MSPWTKKYTLSNAQVAQILEDFVEGSSASPHSWDGFTLGMSCEDENLEDIRIRCAGLSEEFPPDNPKEYCNKEGRDVIREYVRQLRNLKQPIA